MIPLSDLLVCAVCHGNLPLKGATDLAGEEQIECAQCGRSYTCKAGVYNMTPLPPPDDEVKAKWDTWEKLQENGLLSYTEAPEFNLSIGVREDVQAFKEFAQPSGLTLDIGCGPQAYPSYLSEGSTVVGIDPLLGQQPRGFSFVQGIGEYLPFRDNTFDHILYASSLDHIMAPRRSLAEAVRCLKPNGPISLWIDGLGSGETSSNTSFPNKYFVLAKKGLKSLTRHSWVGQIGLSRTLSYLGSVARLKVPEGASDYFHFTHLDLATVSNWLKELDLVTIRQKDYPAADSVFIQVEARSAGTNQ